MIPISEAFNKIGRERFVGAWTGGEIALLDDWPTSAALAEFSPSERAAFDRCTAVLRFLTEELAAGRAVAVTMGPQHRLHDVHADRWRDSLFDGHFQDAGENLAGYLTDRLTSHFIRFAAAKTTEVGAGPARKKSKGGRKAAADWDAHKPAFVERCAGGNLPDDPGNDWGSKENAIQWLIERVNADEVVKSKRTREEPYEATHSAARDRIGKWVAELKNGN